MAKLYSNLKDSKTRKNHKAYVIRIPKDRKAVKDLKLLRIVLTEQETKIDFGYRPQGATKPYDFSEGKTQVYLFSKEKNKKWALQDLSNFTNEPHSSWFFFTFHFPSLLKDLDFNTSSIFDLVPKQDLLHVDLILNEAEGLRFNHIALNEAAALSELKLD